MSTTVSAATWANMAAMQHSVTAQLTDNQLWHLEGYPFYRKGWQEAGEILDHLNDNWWKNTPFNFHQVRMEVVDIMHFLLSEAICNVAARQRNLTHTVDLPKLFEEVGELFADAFETRRRGVQIDPSIDNVCENRAMGPYFHYIHDAVEPFIRESIKYGEACSLNMQESGPWDLARPTVMWLKRLLTEFAHLVHATKMADGDLTFWYAAKAALNKFRNHNGYKSGHYIKVWSGIEDNEFLTTMELEFKHIATLEEMVKSIYSRLGSLYYTHAKKEPVSLELVD